ncbi:hypothetical protein A1F94_003745 [Pyrenophora tritici-repentis]|nr:hypothetical protein A1F94_003745 [Pyrenophora tritici-repentis]KAI1671868.1 hypothetical protein L13192_02727 [Pyrenophora tritici-repentis]KAI1685875.1 hypothetical protein KJE20_03840 [Pyrenophora tritici-repentis]PZC89527.1 hypothetical protein A1F95_10228 [Pyrenophora tritici-repentis]PZD23421.1 hypothetical protein A1F96_10265 [Pyrenophora tritici-repentis]
MAYWLSSKFSQSSFSDAASYRYPYPISDMPPLLQGNGAIPSFSEQTSILSALGTLIGYIGAEAATDQVFERLLWPQRFWNGFSIYHALQVAMFMPMGGPLHRAALHTLDKFFENGLFKGDKMGHMLGTAFFRNSGWSYAVWYNGQQESTELVRNGLWIRAASLLPIPIEKQQKGLETGRPVRARTTLNTLVLDYTTSPLPKKDNAVSQETKGLSLKIFFALLVSEFSGVLAGVTVAVVWRSWFAWLWFAPLLLKWTSAIFAVAREDLAPKVVPSAPAATERTKLFEILHPQQGIFLIEGNESTVLQFFRHYGHPVRSRTRERAQFAIIICFGLMFPVGLVSSIIWMPTSMQYLWLGYQLYATLAMYVYRYTNSHIWATTEEALAAKFKEAGFKRSTEKSAKAEPIYLDGGNGNILSATLMTTYHNSFGSARDAAKAHLQSTTSVPRKTSRESSKTLSPSDLDSVNPSDNWRTSLEKE